MRIRTRLIQLRGDDMDKLQRGQAAGQRLGDVGMAGKKFLRVRRLAPFQGASIFLQRPDQPRIIRGDARIKSLFITIPRRERRAGEGSYLAGMRIIILAHNDGSNRRLIKKPNSLATD